MKKSNLLTTAAAVMLLTAAPAAAQTCIKTPSCADLGYTKTAADCAGKLSSNARSTILKSTARAMRKHFVPTRLAILMWTLTVLASEPSYKSKQQESMELWLSLQEPEHIKKLVPIVKICSVILNFYGSRQPPVYYKS